MLGRVLIANRGEVAVRVARACQDAGIASAAVYADPDRDALHVRAADEAFALGGDRQASNCLDTANVLQAAKDSGADAIRPGYGGVLSENADFAQRAAAQLVPGVPDLVGGGHGLKVARNPEEVPELHKSAVREASTTFGRGDCCLNESRHVETQSLAGK